MRILIETALGGCVLSFLALLVRSLMGSGADSAAYVAVTALVVIVSWLIGRELLRFFEGSNYNNKEKQ